MDHLSTARRIDRIRKSPSIAAFAQVTAETP
jgi:hypothetical protein